MAAVIDWSAILPAVASGWVLSTLSAAAFILSLWAIVQVLRTRKEPMAMLAWVLGILLVPLLGVGFYFLIGERRVKRRVHRKRRRRGMELISRAIASASRQEGLDAYTVGGTDLPALLCMDEGLRPLAAISARLGEFQLTSGNLVKAFTCAQEVYDDLLREIDRAEHHIHLEYYIFRPDRTGRLFRDRLAARAREGIEVRLLLDGVGSFWTRLGFLRSLKAAGAQVTTFMPAIPLGRHWQINCRNHRKIAVFDGRCAYTGSQNIGDEHRGLLPLRRPWKETHLRIEGPAAVHLQDVFVEDWFFASGQDLATGRYLRRQAPCGDSLVQIVPSGPDRDESTLGHIFFTALSQARSSIRISTPYFVPDPCLILALQNAAHRGLEVEVMVPTKTDSRLVLWAGRSYYQELIRAGVRIYEYDLGMLHSKTVIIDDRWSMVGSANMDVRSFFLNFEVTACTFDESIARTICEDFRATREKCRPIRPFDGAREPPAPSMLEGAARLLSPLL